MQWKPKINQFTKEGHTPRKFAVRLTATVQLISSQEPLTRSPFGNEVMAAASDTPAGETPSRKA